LTAPFEKEKGEAKKEGEGGGIAGWKSKGRWIPMRPKGRSCGIARRACQTTCRVQLP